MARYIDANELKEKILKERDKIPKTRIERYSFGVETPNRDGNAMRGGIRKALRCLEQTPTADVVPRKIFDELEEIMVNANFVTGNVEMNLGLYLELKKKYGVDRDEQKIL